MGTTLNATEDLLEEINLDPDDEIEEIAQNVAALLATPKGSVPLLRGMGLDQFYHDLPQRVAQRQLEMEMTEALENYEPRVELLQATTQERVDGITHFGVEVEINGG
jgi:phage baseplate assembly protein W